MAKGRGNSSAITVNSATKLDLSYLIHKKLIQKDRQIIFTLNWTNGIEIGAISNYTDKDIYIRLTYKVTDKNTNEFKDYDYKIYLAKKKSNLGIGEVLYFVCPESAIYCRKLFMCYGYYRFKSKQAYNNRIYYYSQTHSKEYRLNGQYFKYTEIIDELYKKRKTKLYNGKPTKRNLRLKRLLNKRAEVDELRDAQLYVWLNRYLGINS